ncbi:MAG: hypothetical protein GC153_07530 [Alphaproteobacteria bacterium]|nr:hypothetical protein [Alphaproteobacteria bacterium]
MTDRPLSSDREARLERASAYLEAYGAERRRWPEEAHALFDQICGDRRFEERRRAAARLDETLSAFLAPRADEALKERLLASFDPPSRRASLLSFGAGAPRWGRLVPAGILAGLSALGFAIGAATANTGVENDPAFSAPATFAYLSDQGDAPWANE